MWGGPDPFRDIAIAARSTWGWSAWRELSVQRGVVGRGAKADRLPKSMLFYFRQFLVVCRFHARVLEIFA